MKTKISVGLLALATWFSPAAFSQSSGMHSYVEPWGMSGCGFMSLFVKDKSRGPQLGASVVSTVVDAFTGLSSTIQTFGISSGTSNCVAGRVELLAREQEAFITVNLASLSKEAAQGHGEHIAALAEVFGCPSLPFAHLSQSRYDAIFQAPDPQQVRDNYLNELKHTPELAAACTRSL